MKCKKSIYYIKKKHIIRNVSDFKTNSLCPFQKTIKWPAVTSSEESFIKLRRNCSQESFHFKLARCLSRLCSIARR